MLINSDEYIAIVESIKKEIGETRYRAAEQIHNKFSGGYKTGIPWGHNTVLLDKIADFERSICI